MRRSDFPLLQQNERGGALVYLDSGATTQKPQVVIDRIAKYYQSENANVHRGIYGLSERATLAYEGVREKVGSLLGLSKERAEREIIFTRGTTESINLVAQSWGAIAIKKGDAIAVTRVEHHSNFVPWQALARRSGAEFLIIESDDEGLLDNTGWKQVLSRKPKIVSFTAISNVTGQVMPVEKWASMAKAAGVDLVFVDAAQAIGHHPMDLNQWPSVDGLAFSGHKMCGPTGVGVLWLREKFLKEMSPYQYGGDMILQVGDQESQWNDLPWKFEAGTPNISGVIGLGSAVDYLRGVGLTEIACYEAGLTQYALDRLAENEGVRCLGSLSAENRAPVFSVIVDGVHPHDLSTFLDSRGIAVRAGHHCAQPLMRRLKTVATLRMSLAFYNEKSEIDFFCESIKEAQKYFKKGGRS